LVRDLGDQIAHPVLILWWDPCLHQNLLVCRCDLWPEPVVLDERAEALLPPQDVGEFLFIDPALPVLVEQAGVRVVDVLVAHEEPELFEQERD
jgi:hypothetical protein